MSRDVQMMVTDVIAHKHWHVCKKGQPSTLFSSAFRTVHGGMDSVSSIDLLILLDPLWSIHPIPPLCLISQPSLRSPSKSVSFSIQITKLNGPKLVRPKHQHRGLPSSTWHLQNASIRRWSCSHVGGPLAEKISLKSTNKKGQCDFMYLK